MVHIKLTHPEPRGRYNVIEDVQTLDGGIVYLKGEKPASVYMVPGKEPLEYEMANGYIRIPLPKVNGYAMVALEK
jgi:hypothetical protein